jgi:hypothetical protein
VTRKDAIQLAKQELTDGAEHIDAILLLQQKGFSSYEAEELVELASEELE